MAIMEPQMAFPEPWSDLRDGGPEDDEQREVLQAELAEELSAGHVLHGREFVVVARSEANDDVLVALDDGTWALVHLTWRGTPERPPRPATVVFSAVTDAVAAMLE
jgi:hypothetical protein